MTLELTAHVDPSDCLEMEIKEDLSVPKSLSAAIKHDPSLIPASLPLQVAPSQATISTEAGFYIQVSIITFIKLLL